MKLASIPVRSGLALLVIAVLLAIFRPWVVAPLDGEGKPSLGPQRFDAEAFAARVWDERLPSHIAAAVSLAQASSAPAFLKGEGVVVSVDTSSRVGVAMVDIDPQDGEADVTLSLGPVVTGSALRDALGLAFADFDTQVQYANVSANLNRRAIAASPLLAAPQALEGKRVSFVGAGTTSAGGGVRLTPVRLAVLP